MRVIQVWRSLIGTATPQIERRRFKRSSCIHQPYQVSKAVYKALSKDCMPWMRSRSKSGDGQHLDEKSSMANDQPLLSYGLQREGLGEGHREACTAGHDTQVQSRCRTKSSTCKDRMCSKSSKAKGVSEEGATTLTPEPLLGVSLRPAPCPIFTSKDVSVLLSSYSPGQQVDHPEDLCAISWI